MPRGRGSETRHAGGKTPQDQCQAGTPNHPSALGSLAVVGAASSTLHLASSSLGPQSPLDRRAARPSGPARARGWRDGRAHPLGKAFTSQSSVLPLGAVVGRDDHDEPVGDAREQPGTLRRRERPGPCAVPAQLDPAVGGVHRLASWPGRPGEVPGELPSGDGDATRHDEVVTDVGAHDRSRPRTGELGETGALPRPSRGPE